MSSPTRWCASGGLLILIGLLTPHPGHAQAEDVGSHETANHLHAQAMTAAGFIHHLEDIPIIARMHGEAASLRDWNDPRAADCWRLQAALLHGIGEHDEALDYLLDAARASLGQGSPLLAAHAFLDAASILEELGRTDEAQELIRSAHGLSLRGGLARSERRDLQQRISVR